MVQTIKYGSTFNPANAFVDDIYLEVIPPPGYFSGIPTSVAAANGTASWGQLNHPMLLSSPLGITQRFGGVNAASVNDPHDLCTDLTQALNQAAGSAGLTIYGTRVSDGTDTQAAVNLYDGINLTLTLTGTLTTGNQVDVVFTNPNLPGGKYALKYVVQSGDTTLSLLGTSLKNAINNDATLAATGFTATNVNAVLTLFWTATGTVIIQSWVNGTKTATIGGTITNLDTVTVTVIDAGLAGGNHAVTYPVTGSDTTTTIATGLRDAINGTPALAALGITATASAAILSIKSLSPNLTTYSSTVTGAQTETVTFGAGPTEIATMSGASQGILLKGKWTGSAANVPLNGGNGGIAIQLAAGTLANTVTATIIPFPGGGGLEIYPNLPGTGALFWAAFQSAINGGINSQRGPSQYLIASGATTTTNPPAFGTFGLAGGTDGRNVNTAQLVGDAQENTGIYPLANVTFAPSVFWICGLTDSSIYSTIQAFADNANIMALLTFPSNTSVDSAATAKQNLGIADYQVTFILGWVYWFDQINDIVRLIPSLSTAGGTIATLAPWESPFNKTVASIVGTERNNPYTGNVPWSNAELAQCTQSGITLITNPIPGRAQFGFRNGYNSIGNKAINSTIEYSRMTNFLVNSNGTILGQFEGKLQGSSASDPLRSQVRAALNAFYQPLKTQGFIDDYTVICDLTNNSKTTIALRSLNINENVRYMASVADIFVQLQGGTTVNTQVNQLGPQIGGLF